MEEMLTLEKFEEATEIVHQVARETKLLYSKVFSDRYGNKIYLKPENMQYTGAYSSEEHIIRSPRYPKKKRQRD